MCPKYVWKCILKMCSKLILSSIVSQPKKVVFVVVVDVVFVFVCVVVLIVVVVFLLMLLLALT